MDAFCTSLKGAVIIKAFVPVISGTDGDLDGVDISLRDTRDNKERSRATAFFTRGTDDNTLRLIVHIEPPAPNARTSLAVSFPCAPQRHAWKQLARTDALRSRSAITALNAHVLDDIGVATFVFEDGSHMCEFMDRNERILRETNVDGPVNATDGSRVRIFGHVVIRLRIRRVLCNSNPARFDYVDFCGLLTTTRMLRDKIAYTMQRETSQELTGEVCLTDGKHELRVSEGLLGDSHVFVKILGRPPTWKMTDLEGDVIPQEFMYWLRAYVEDQNYDFDTAVYERLLDFSSKTVETELVELYRFCTYAGLRWLQTMITLRMFSSVNATCLRSVVRLQDVYDCVHAEGVDAGFERAHLDRCVKRALRYGPDADRSDVICELTKKIEGWRTRILLSVLNEYVAQR